MLFTLLNKNFLQFISLQLLILKISYVFVKLVFCLHVTHLSLSS